MSQISDFAKGSEAVQPLCKGSVVFLYTTYQYTHIVTSCNWFFDGYFMALCNIGSRMNDKLYRV